MMKKRKGIISYMGKKRMALISALALACCLFAGCSGGETEAVSDTQISAAEQTGGSGQSEIEAGGAEDAQAADTAEEDAQAADTTEAGETAADTTDTQAALPDGVYTADFDTDNSMFHISEACDGKGTLTVENGEMTIHISLASKNIVNLYPGLAEDAQKDGAVLLEPTVDSVTYSDGMTEEVYGFDVPVPVLDEEFDLALIGTKGVWYDHKVTVSNPQPAEENASAGEIVITELADGSYSIELAFEGGSGKASILSPATITVEDGAATATIQWSSPNYDYMLVDGEKYLPVSTEGGSVFEIPVSVLDEPMDVVGDTVAMSQPHEIEYTITFYSDSIQAVE